MAGSDSESRKATAAPRWTPVLAAGALAVGIAIGWFARIPEEAPAYVDLARESESTKAELTDSQRLAGDYQETISGLREEVHQLERPFRELDEREGELDEREGELDEREEGLDERAEGLDEREGELDERSTDLDDRETGLDEREEGLDEREEEISAGETFIEDNTFPGSGTYLVGEDIAPGTYRSSGTGSCYWARLSATDGSFDAIIANGLSEGPQVVTILATDVAFETSRCGEWTIN